ncbi:MAG: aminotransferase class V-fold PLP-dependent enzyme, partial [Thermoplasmata archaeon]
YIRSDEFMGPMITGGHQERGLRAGTENVLGIAGLGVAAEHAQDLLPDMERVRRLRDRMEEGIVELVPEARLNGHVEHRLPNTLNLTLPDIRGESLAIALDEHGIAISSGSACRTGQTDPSHALLAMGMSEDDAHCSIRISLGHVNTEEDVERALEVFRGVINNQSGVLRFVSCR